MSSDQQPLLYSGTKRVTENALDFVKLISCAFNDIQLETVRGCSGALCVCYYCRYRIVVLRLQTVVLTF